MTRQTTANWAAADSMKRCDSDSSGASTKLDQSGCRPGFLCHSPSTVTTSASRPMFLDELRNRLYDLDSSISQHEISLQKLKEERTAVQLQLDGFVYPILTIPPEISAEIFLWCSAHIQCRPHPSNAPLLFLKVCRAWRALALSVPALWDSVPEAEFTVPEQMEELITAWFSHAGTRPLSLDLPYLGHESPHLHSLVSRHASRLQTLGLCIDADCYPSLADIRPFPLLRDLNLYSMGDMLKQSSAPMPLFRDAPLLRNLWLENLAPSTLAMPWSQLTKFTASLVSLQECLVVLPLLTSLDEFHRSGAPEEADSEPLLVGRPRMCQSDLTSLVISTSDGDQDILEFLTLPRLQKMTIGESFCTWITDLDADVVQFLSRTYTTLRTFTVSLSDRVPIRWFEIATHLTTLEFFCFKNRSTAALTHALNRHNAPDFLPKLQHFAFLDCGSDQVNSALLDALDSRCADDAADTAHARLESFRLIWPEYDYPNFPIARLPLVNVAPLRALAKRRMLIHIGTRYQNNFY
ncbi:hypothetical protein DFH09DRAFT_1478793 [Mycena vulgaris]|nr:hypothetical protein DFH09DRAFT_1478793 [Mycena vulgaris]